MMKIRMKINENRIKEENRKHDKKHTELEGRNIKRL